MDKGSSKLGVEVTVAHPAHVDERGEIYDIVEEPVGHTGIITFKAGAVRGNHYHHVSVQYNFVIEGKFTLTVSDKEKAIVETYTLEPGSSVRIPNNVVHTLEALTDGRILDLNTLARSDNAYEQDTVRVS